METRFYNSTLNSSVDWDCELGPSETAIVALVDILTFLIGHAVTAKLLWLIFRSKKPIDILSCNLAFFHKVQYWAAALHLAVLFAFTDIHMLILNVSSIYVQIGGPMSFAFICMERYVAVIHPTSYCLLKKYRCRGICAALVWLMTIPAVLAYLCSESLKEFKIMPLALMMLMSAIMLWCSIRIAWTLKKLGPGQDKLHPMKRRAFRTVCATTSITMICYVPVVYLQNFKLQDENTYHCTITPLCLLLLSASSVVHPLFYLSNQGKLSFCSMGKKKTR